jgi:putative tricarboxylic transport membrane protein
VNGSRSRSVAGLLIGLGLIAIAAVIAMDAMNMRVPPVHAKVGPRVFPYLVSCGLALSGAAIAWQAWRRSFLVEAQETDWGAVAIVAAGLVLQINLLKPLGFVPAAIILFMAVTFAFGSRRFLRDGIVATILAVLTYLAFTRLLGLQLPPGVLKGII